MNIQQRHLRTYNNDPQRRCYYGVHANQATVWGQWETLEINVPESKVEERLNFWRELNAYAQSERGSSVKKEFRAVEETSDLPVPSTP